MLVVLGVWVFSCGFRRVPNDNLILSEFQLFQRSCKEVWGGVNKCSKSKGVSDRFQGVLERFLRVSATFEGVQGFLMELLHIPVQAYRCVKITPKIYVGFFAHMSSTAWNNFFNKPDKIE